MVQAQVGFIIVCMHQCYLTETLVSLNSLANVGPAFASWAWVLDNLGYFTSTGVLVIVFVRERAVLI